MANYKQQVKNTLCKMFDIPEGFSSGMVESIVDDIIEATIEEMRKRHLTPATPDSEGLCHFNHAGLLGNYCSNCGKELR